MVTLKYVHVFLVTQVKKKKWKDNLNLSRQKYYCQVPIPNIMVTLLTSQHREGTSQVLSTGHQLGERGTEWVAA